MGLVQMTWSDTLLKASYQGHEATVRVHFRGPNHLTDIDCPSLGYRDTADGAGRTIDAVRNTVREALQARALTARAAAVT